MKTVPRDSDFAVSFLKTNKQVFVCVPPLPDVLNNDSGMPITASTDAFPRRNSTTWRYDLLERMLSGKTSPNLPFGWARRRHCSTNKTWGGTLDTASSVAYHCSLPLLNRHFAPNSN